VEQGDIDRWPEIRREGERERKREKEIGRERATHRSILEQCFPTFFDSRHPYLVFQIFGGTLC